MEQTITFTSDGLALNGFLHQPDGAGKRRAGLVLCHGFGGSCRGAGIRSWLKRWHAAGFETAH